MAQKEPYEVPAMTPEQYAFDTMAPDLGPSASGQAVPTLTDVATVGPIDILARLAQKYPFLDPVGNMWARRQAIHQHIGQQMDEAERHYEDVPPFNQMAPGLESFGKMLEPIKGR